MTKAELESFEQFGNLDEYDGNNMDIEPPRHPPEYIMNSAMTIEEAELFLSRPECTPQYIERHTSDDGSVGYEVIFWERKHS